jgi:hypothetical protein
LNFIENKIARRIEMARLGLNSIYQRRLETRKGGSGKRILMSCGGGMAGSKWYHEVTDIDMDGEFIEAICISGQNLTLGKQWVVKIIDVDFHAQVLDKDGDVTIEWYDVPKGGHVEHCNVERDRTQPHIMTPCHIKSLLWYNQIN